MEMGVISVMMITGCYLCYHYYGDISDYEITYLQLISARTISHIGISISYY